MTKELLDDSALKPYEGKDIRSSIADRIKSLRAKFRMVPMQLSRYYKRIAADLDEKWEEENRIYRKENERETPPERLKRWKEMKKRYRLYGLQQVSDRWYGPLRKLRGELALVVAMYQFSDIDKIPTSQLEWKEGVLDDFDSLVLRMRGPRKPSKKNFKMKDLDYDVGASFLGMMEKHVEWANKTKKSLKNLTAPRKKMKYKTRVKRFRNAVKAREYLTILCQSLAPRSKALKLIQRLEDMEDDEDIWLQVLDD